MRIDLYLFDCGLASSRTEAKRYVIEGMVRVNGRLVVKPSFEVDDNSDVVLDSSSIKYASRGGLKLEAALAAFDVKPEGRKCIDIGASSGGFTDCLLINGAMHVVAMDSGSGQIVPRLRADERVTVVENYNARYMTPSDIPYAPSLAVMDVSFISATYIIGSLVECLDDNADFICLIKPQFEVGRSAVGKGGIVRDEKQRMLAVDKVVAYSESVGLKKLGVITSPIKGGDGNVEFLAHFKKESC